MLENIENQKDKDKNKICQFLSKIFQGVFFDRKRDMILTRLIINNLGCFCQN